MTIRDLLKYGFCSKTKESLDYYEFSNFPYGYKLFKVKGHDTKTHYRSKVWNYSTNRQSTYKGFIEEKN